MNLTPEINNYEDQLDKLLKELRQLNPADNLYSSITEYVCIRITGYLEVSLDSLLITYANKETKSATLNSVVNKYISQFNSANNDNIRNMLGAFENQWSEDFAKELINESRNRRDLVQMLGAVFSLRNKVAHGQAVNITPTQLREYYDMAKKVVRIVARIIP